MAFEGGLDGVRAAAHAADVGHMLCVSVNLEHFDLYAQGPTTDTPFAPGEHIPGLNVGGWYDAGDYDIRTQSQYGTVLSLVSTWERFRPLRDTTLVDYAPKFVDLHVADGKPDILQQIEHGTIALLAQHRAVGHAIHGIIVPTLEQYTHLGDGLTMTDNQVYSPDLGELEATGTHSGVPDDRWAFTSRSSALNYGSAAALAAASRALRGYDDALAAECLEVALGVWSEEQAKDEPDLYRHGNTTGGPLVTEELRAAIELLAATDDARFAKHIAGRLPEIGESFPQLATIAVRAMPHLDEAFARAVRGFAETHRDRLDAAELLVEQFHRLHVDLADHQVRRKAPRAQLDGVTRLLRCLRQEVVGEQAGDPGLQDEVVGFAQEDVMSQFARRERSLGIDLDAGLVCNAG